MRTAEAYSPSSTALTTALSSTRSPRERGGPVEDVVAVETGPLGELVVLQRPERRPVAVVRRLQQAARRLPTGVRWRTPEHQRPLAGGVGRRRPRRLGRRRRIVRESRPARPWPSGRRRSAPNSPHAATLALVAVSTPRRVRLSSAMAACLHTVKSVPSTCPRVNAVTAPARDLLQIGEATRRVDRLPRREGSDARERWRRRRWRRLPLGHVRRAAASRRGRAVRPARCRPRHARHRRAPLRERARPGRTGLAFGRARCRPAVAPARPVAQRG